MYNFGKSPADRRIFQLDREYPRFIENKEDCRREGIEKYYVRAREHPETIRTITRFMAERLTEEYPEYFVLRKSGAVCELTNRLRSLTLRWTIEGVLLDTSSYTSLFDALADQVPEDLAVWQAGDGEDYLSTIHLCAPNHWAPAEKVGKPFSLVHEPVAGMEALRRRYQPMLRSLLRPDTWVRFAWGLSTDTRLNHHPEAPDGVAYPDWAGRVFDPAHPQLFVRVERQTLTGFPEVKAVLFTIRTYFEEVRYLSPPEQQALLRAIQSMSEASLRYKGLYRDQKQVLDWLEAL